MSNSTGIYGRVLVKVAGELSHDPSVRVDRAGRKVAQSQIFLHALGLLRCFCPKPIQIAKSGSWNGALRVTHRAAEREYCSNNFLCNFFCIAASKFA
jgi:hypothetical protein